MNLVIYTLVVIFTICECKSINSTSQDYEKSLYKVCKISIELMSKIYSHVHEISEKIYYKIRPRLIDDLRRRFPSNCEATIQSVIKRIGAKITSVEPFLCFQYLDEIMDDLGKQVKEATQLMTRIKQKQSEMSYDDRNLLTTLENHIDNVVREDLKKEYILTEQCYQDLTTEIEKEIHRIKPSPKHCGNLINYHIPSDHL